MKKNKLKEYLIRMNIGLTDSDFIQGYPLSFDTIKKIIKNTVGYFIDIPVDAIRETIKELRDISYELGNKLTWQEFVVLVEAEEKYHPQDKYVAHIKYGICNVSAIYDYLREELIPIHDYESMAYVYYYIDRLDEELLGFDDMTLSVENFYKAGKYDYAVKICKQEIENLELKTDDFLDNPNYYKLKEFEKLIAEHEQESEM